MAEKIKKIKWFWPWQDDKEEAWLEEQSKKGYHLSQLGAFGRFTFEKGETKGMIYRLDFMIDQENDKKTYLQIFQDAGWEYLGELNGWQYFRKEKTAGNETAGEIFTDQQSKIQKYKRLMTFQFMVFIILLLLFVSVTEPWESFVWLDLVLTLFYMGLLIMQGTITLKIHNRIQALKSKITE
jgi:hypothetical protein